MYKVLHYVSTRDKLDTKPGKLEDLLLNVIEISVVAVVPEAHHIRVDDCYLSVMCNRSIPHVPATGLKYMFS